MQGFLILLASLCLAVALIWLLYELLTFPGKALKKLDALIAESKRTNELLGNAPSGQGPRVLEMPPESRP